MEIQKLRKRVVLSGLVMLMGLAARAYADDDDCCCCDDGPVVQLKPQWWNDELQNQHSNAYVPQLNLLSTPDVLGRNQWYASGIYSFEKSDDFNDTKYNTFTVGGMYGITNEIAVGGNFPVLENIDFSPGGSETDIGDLWIQGQYNLTPMLHLGHPNSWAFTGQLGIGVPTGSERKGTGSGHFDFEPELTAFHSFRGFGAGTLGAFGEIGFDVSRASGVRAGLGVTYGIDKFVVNVEALLTTTGGGRTVTFAPGVEYMGLNHWEFGFGVPIGYDHNTIGLNTFATYIY